MTSFFNLSLPLYSPTNLFSISKFTPHFQHSFCTLFLYKTHHSHTTLTNKDKPNMSFSLVSSIMEYVLLLCMFAFLSSTPFFAESKISAKMGINYGQLGNNLPSPAQAIQHIQSLKAYRVKLYNSDPQILKLLANTKLQVAIAIPNQEISLISANQTVADEWVRTNIVPYLPQTQIRFLLVGNEVFSYYSDADKETWNNLVPAMFRIKRAMKTNRVRNVKVGTPVAMDVLETSFPPSNSTFRKDISERVIRPLLSFLNRTNSFFYVDVYPYFPWSANPSEINLDYALLRPTNVTYTDPGTNLTYTNLLDQMLDSVSYAMQKLGYPDVRLFITETGWPSGGDLDQVGANIYNAATYNRNLVRKITKKPIVGTPARPGAVIPAFIFSLYNENQKEGPGTERNWGLLYPNGSRVYEVDLTGEQIESEYEPLPMGTNNVPYKGKLWCVVARNSSVNSTVNSTEIGAAIAYACAQSNETCFAIQPGKNCYQPVSLTNHANYAFSSYWKQFRSTGGSCYFNGLAVQTSKDPSHGNCSYPSVTI